jgi:hypothetical protein
MASNSVSGSVASDDEDRYARNARHATAKWNRRLEKAKRIPKTFPKYKRIVLSMPSFGGSVDLTYLVRAPIVRMRAFDTETGEQFTSFYGNSAPRLCVSVNDAGFEFDLDGKLHPTHEGGAIMIAALRADCKTGVMACVDANGYIARAGEYVLNLGSPNVDRVWVTTGSTASNNMIPYGPRMVNLELTLLVDSVVYEEIACPSDPWERLPLKHIPGGGKAPAPVLESSTDEVVVLREGQTAVFAPAIAGKK